MPAAEKALSRSSRKKLWVEVEASPSSCYSMWTTPLSPLPPPARMRQNSLREITRFPVSPSPSGTQCIYSRIFLLAGPRPLAKSQECPVRSAADRRREAACGLVRPSLRLKKEHCAIWDIFSWECRRRRETKVCEMMTFPLPFFPLGWTEGESMAAVEAVQHHTRCSSCIFKMSPPPPLPHTNTAK